ncbi:MAG TPA: glycosyltransferase family 2 protein [Solirubrobacterales bacterium]|nr:glycosyltransferase family 2 protein [Solirubrobacterales bacterium]
MSATISACVIARDEEARLPDCLASLRFCDQVVVVDSGSVDRTRELAAAAGAKVVENPWPGFAAQRNVALDHASGEWVLEIDADERVSPQLAAEIEAFLAAPPAAVRMGAIPMRDVFLGAPLGPSTRYPRYRHRLFRRGAFRHDESRGVHEGLWPDGPVHPFSGELTHLLASSWGEAVRDARAYARLEGSQRGRPGAAEAVVGILIRPAVKLAYRVGLYGGWRDGWRGIGKVWLECAADSLATLHRLRHGVAGGAGGFGQEPPRVGPVRIAGVALSARGAGQLAPWLQRAAKAGADVVLIGAEPPGDSSVRHRPLAGGRPGALARAIDAEDQLRPVDALLLAGRRERAALRLLPGALRGATAPLSPAASPPEATAALRVQSRTQEPA